MLKLSSYVNECKPLPQVHALLVHGDDLPLGSRVIQNKHSNRYRSVTYLQSECSYRHEGLNAHMASSQYRVAHVSVWSASH